MIKRLIILTAVLISLVFAVSATAQSHKPIKIATEGAYAPFNFKDKGGNLVGFEVDLAVDLCKRMGIQYTLVEQAWDGMIPSLLAGKYDVIMAAMSIKAKREKVISFSRTYIDGANTFVALKTSNMAGFKGKLDSITLDDVSAEEKVAMKELSDAFKGKTIGVQLGTTNEDFVKSMMPDMKVKSYEKVDNILLDIISERIDLALVPITFLTPLMEKPEGKKIQLVGPQFTKGPFGRGVGAGIRKENSELREMFSKAINEAIADGTIRELSMKWFKFDLSPRE